MKIDQMLEKIPSITHEKIRTSEDKRKAKSYIDMLLEKLYSKDFSNTPLEEQTKSLGSSYVIEAILGWHRARGRSDSLESIKDSLEELGRYLDSLEEVIIKTAVRLDRQHTIEISNWIRENIGEDYLVELDEDPALIGGAVLIFNGNYIDKSIKKRFEDYNHSINQIIEKVVKQ